jgi:SAM-dependent methyltransferase
LKKASVVVASDIDESALSKLYHTTPEKYRSRLEIKTFDMTKPFPFDDDSFDGIFCAGILHLFPTDVFGRISYEMDRTLRPKGKVIIDFSADIKRVAPDGKPIVFGNEPRYTSDEAKKLLRKGFEGYEIRIQESNVFEDCKAANPPYKKWSKGILLVAVK